MAHLNQKEMIEFTGSDTPTTQKNMLEKNNIPYMRKNDGSIVTTWEAINHVLIQQASNEPNFDAMDNY